MICNAPLNPRTGADGEPMRWCSRPATWWHEQGCGSKGRCTWHTDGTDRDRRCSICGNDVDPMSDLDELD